MRVRSKSVENTSIYQHQVINEHTDRYLSHWNSHWMISYFFRQDVGDHRVDLHMP